MCSLIFFFVSNMSVFSNWTKLEDRREIKKKETTRKRICMYRPRGLYELQIHGKNRQKLREIKKNPPVDVLYHWNEQHFSVIFVSIIKRLFWDIPHRSYVFLLGAASIVHFTNYKYLTTKKKTGIPIQIYIRIPVYVLLYKNSFMAVSQWYKCNSSGLLIEMI